jgi:sirohydrochlorin ferrochelatase
MRRNETWLVALRYGLPGVIFLAGVVVTAVASDKETGLLIGTMFMGAAIAVFLLNFFYRMGVTGDRDRDAEEARRRYFDEHGRWPDER